MISLKRLDRDQSELGYWIVTSFWNTGLASEAVQALIKANPMTNTSIFAAVFQENLAAARVLRKSGFSYLGDAEIYSVARGEMCRRGPIQSSWAHERAKHTPDTGSQAAAVAVAAAYGFGCCGYRRYFKRFLNH